MIVNGKCQNCGARDQQDWCSYCRTGKSRRDGIFWIHMSTGPIDIVAWMQQGIITPEEFRELVLEAS